MTDYLEVPPSAYEAGAPDTDELNEAQVNNPLAIAEGSPGAPIAQTGWHPYNSLKVQDGFSGELYSFGTDGNTQAIGSGDLPAGYEYMLMGQNLRVTNNTDILVDGFQSVAGIYSTVWQVTGIDNGARIHFFSHFVLPQVDQRFHWVNGQGRISEIGAQNFVAGGVIYNNNLHKITRIRLRSNTGTIVGGQLYLYRRREFVSDNP